MNKEHESKKATEVLGHLLGGNLVENLEKLAKLADNLQGLSPENETEKKDKKVVEGELDLKKIKEGLKANYHFSLGKASSNQRTGSIPRNQNQKQTPFKSGYKKEAKTRDEPKATFKTIEPEYDLFCDKSKVLLVIQLPGVKPESISAKLIRLNQALELIAESKEFRFNKVIDFDSPVSELFEQTFKNGVLSISFDSLS
ncbi:MAG: hypothetical protein SFU91_02745 [Chloroherpetonaceae bacterium]|nr:hypothetical protein [Chloroherpetonaceae bacterium]